MNRKRTPVGKSTVPPAGRARRRRGRRPAVLGGFVAIVLAGAVVFGWLRNREESRETAPTVATVLAQARQAEERGDFEGAFAAIREGLRHFPNDPVLLGTLGTATQNRSYAVRTNRGRVVPVTPTSRERVAAAREALALLEASERSRPADPNPALHRGLLLAAWGLPEDALVELFRARVLGGTSPEIDRVGGAITLLQLGSAADSLAQNGRPASR